jgi:hypothetical protein
MGRLPNPVHALAPHFSAAQKNQGDRRISGLADDQSVEVGLGFARRRQAAVTPTASIPKLYRKRPVSRVQK